MRSTSARHWPAHPQEARQHLHLERGHLPLATCPPRTHHQPRAAVQCNTLMPCVRQTHARLLQRRARPPSQNGDGLALLPEPAPISPVSPRIPLTCPAQFHPTDNSAQLPLGPRGLLAKRRYLSLARPRAPATRCSSRNLHHTRLRPLATLAAVPRAAEVGSQKVDGLARRLARSGRRGWAAAVGDWTYVAAHTGGLHEPGRWATRGKECVLTVSNEASDSTTKSHYVPLDHGSESGGRETQWTL